VYIVEISFHRLKRVKYREIFKYGKAMAKKSTKNKAENPPARKLVKTLGIDLSIGKVKLCLLSLDHDSKSIGGGWSSLPVDFEPVAEKEYDFNRGLAIAIEAFLSHHHTDASEINSVIFCSGGAYYMFKSFAEGMRYTGAILKMIFPRQPVFFIRCDGELFKLNDVFELPDSEASAFACTNYLGTAILAGKTFNEGLAIDMGTISTSIIPILNGKIDPVAAYNPAGYVQHRYTTGKHVWYGVMHTPLTYITQQAKTKRTVYNLILRSCTTNTLCSLLNIVDPGVANAHVQENSRISDTEISFIRMAETLGLDINSISRDELLEAATDIYYQFLYKLGEIIRNITGSMNYHNFDNLKVLATGLGQQAFIIPALVSSGFNRSQIITVGEDKQSNLWTAASVYGLALLALEKIIGESIDVRME
jgi:uncharacterized hydantoinase/oxoprolinase family protein